VLLLGVTGEPVRVVIPPGRTGNKEPAKPLAEAPLRALLVCCETRTVVEIGPGPFGVFISIDILVSTLLEGSSKLSYFTVINEPHRLV
jgi:hypothetical protein